MCVIVCLYVCLIGLDGLFTVEHVEKVKVPSILHGALPRPASHPSLSVSDLEQTQLNLILPSSSLASLRIVP